MTEASREFLFEYRFGGLEWGITIHASDPVEAREKIKAVGLARYQGEVAAKVGFEMPTWMQGWFEGGAAGCVIGVVLGLALASWGWR